MRVLEMSDGELESEYRRLQAAAEEAQRKGRGRLYDRLVRKLQRFIREIGIRRLTGKYHP